MPIMWTCCCYRQSEQRVDTIAKWRELYKTASCCNTTLSEEYLVGAGDKVLLYYAYFCVGLLQSHTTVAGGGMVARTSTVRLSSDGNLKAEAQGAILYTSKCLGVDRLRRPTEHLLRQSQMQGRRPQYCLLAGYLHHHLWNNS